MSQEKPREITARPKTVGPSGRESEGWQVRDSYTGAVLEVPRPVKRNGVEVVSREAAEHLAGLLLLVQGVHGTLAWDRDTSERIVFTVFPK